MGVASAPRLRAEENEPGRLVYVHAASRHVAACTVAARQIGAWKPLPHWRRTRTSDVLPTPSQMQRLSKVATAPCLPCRHRQAPSRLPVDAARRQVAPTALPWRCGVRVASRHSRLIHATGDPSPHWCACDIMPVCSFCAACRHMGWRLAAPQLPAKPPPTLVCNPHPVAPCSVLHVSMHRPSHIVNALVAGSGLCLLLAFIAPNRYNNNR